jgi:hypothetical protein
MVYSRDDGGMPEYMRLLCVIVDHVLINMRHITAALCTGRPVGMLTRRYAKDTNSAALCSSRTHL